MTAISQQDWQDQEDGRALRELQKVAAAHGHHVTLVQEHDRWTVRVLNAEFALVMRCDAFDRLSRNADACRAALRERAA